MFRAECKAGTELGKQACSILAKGGLVPDEVTNGIVANRIARADCAAGFMLDGYPRTVPQAMFFSALLRERGLPRPVVIHLDVPDGELVTRVTARRQCPVCQHIYNLISQPPRTDGKCDHDGADLICRDDDHESVIRQRLAAYRQLTGPILAWYGAALVHTVNGAMKPEDVERRIEEVVLNGTGAEVSVG